VHKPHHHDKVADHGGAAAVSFSSVLRTTDSISSIICCYLLGFTPIPNYTAWCEWYLKLLLPRKLQHISVSLDSVVLYKCCIFYYYFFIFYTPGSKGSRGLKTKIKKVAGMAIGPGNRCWMSRAKARSKNVGSSQRCTGVKTEPLCRRQKGSWFFGPDSW